MSRKKADKQVMNQILYNRGMPVNYNNVGIFADLLKRKEGVNTIWGQEYFMMNGRSFMDNADKVIEIMMKCKNPG